MSANPTIRWHIQNKLSVRRVSWRAVSLRECEFAPAKREGDWYRLLGTATPWWQQAIKDVAQILGSLVFRKSFRVVGKLQEQSCHDAFQYRTADFAISIIESKMLSDVLDLHRATDPAVDGGKFRAQLRTPRREQFEFERQHAPLPVSYGPHIVVAESSQPVGDALFGFQNGAQARGMLVDFFLQQRKEEFFLGLKMCIERSARVAGLGRDVLNAARLKAVAGEDQSRGRQQFSLSFLRSDLMLIGEFVRDAARCLPGANWVGK